MGIALPLLPAGMLRPAEMRGWVMVAVLAGTRMTFLPARSSLAPGKALLLSEGVVAHSVQGTDTISPTLGKYFLQSEDLAGVSVFEVTTRAIGFCTGSGFSSACSTFSAFGSVTVLAGFASACSIFAENALMPSQVTCCGRLPCDTPQPDVVSTQRASP